jgi:rRNA maturation endonuclease Nob1
MKDYTVKSIVQYEGKADCKHIYTHRGTVSICTFCGKKIKRVRVSASELKKDIIAKIDEELAILQTKLDEHK